MKKIYGYIYKITNIINNKIYIGQTVRKISIRFAEHVKASEIDTLKLHLAIKKYGKENFKCEMIDTALSLDELNEKEAYWVSKYNSDIDGYNMKPGGEYNPMNVSAIKEKHDQVMRSDAVRAKISKTMREYKKLNPVTQETRAKLAKNNLGKIYIHNNLNEEKRIDKNELNHYLQLGWVKGAAKDRPEIIQNRVNKIQKIVYCIDENNNIVNTFNSVKLAAE